MEPSRDTGKLTKKDGAALRVAALPAFCQQVAENLSIKTRTLPVELTVM